MPVLVTSSHTNNTTATQQRQFLQPNELHDYLKSANEISCKSELRAIASSHNGMCTNPVLSKIPFFISTFKVWRRLNACKRDMMKL